MKAYHVHDKNESGEEAMHEVVFAETPAQAKFKSDAYSSGTDWNNISTRRVPIFDAYAGKEIPNSAYIADGWTLDCDKCGNMTTVTEVGDKVYCDSCLDEFPELLAPKEGAEQHE